MTAKRFLLYVLISMMVITGIVFIANWSCEINSIGKRKIQLNDKCRSKYGNDMRFSYFVYQKRTEQNSITHAQISGGISGNGAAGEYIINGYYEDRQWKILTILVTSDNGEDIFVREYGDSLER